MKRTSLNLTAAEFRNELYNKEFIVVGFHYIENMKHSFESVLEYVALPKPPITGANRKLERDAYGFLLSDWLRIECGVKKIFEIYVEDSVEFPHSDTSIIRHLKDFDIEIWKWRKLDICTTTIAKAAPNVRKVYLACNSKQSVLKGWLCDAGLPQLKKVSSYSTNNASILVYRQQRRPRFISKLLIVDESIADIPTSAFIVRIH